VEQLGPNPIVVVGERERRARAITAITEGSRNAFDYRGFSDAEITREEHAVSLFEFCRE
jgi:hypothetical protein